MPKANAVKATSKEMPSEDEEDPDVDGTRIFCAEAVFVGGSTTGEFRVVMVVPLFGLDFASFFVGTVFVAAIFDPSLSSLFSELASE